VVQVSSATVPDDVLVDGSSPSTRIRIGDPLRTISGRHRYRIRYLLDRVAVDRRLAWDAVGTEWPVPIGDVRVDVVAPFEFLDPRCVRGVAGSTTSCRVAQPEPGHLVVRLRALRPPGGHDQRRPARRPAGHGRRAGRRGPHVAAGAAGRP
jgi:hypothetical protein